MVASFFFTQKRPAMNATNQKLALVSGSNKGIGYATVKELLKTNYAVILCSRDIIRGKKAFEELKPFGELYFHQLDIADESSIAELVKYVEDKFGKLDVLINNAAHNYDTYQQAMNADLALVKDTFEVNLFGTWRMCQAFIPLLKQSQSPRMVNVSSRIGSFSHPSDNAPAYCTSKAALNMLTVKLSRELKTFGILVNSVCPGVVRTDMGGMNAEKSPKEGSETIIWAANFPDDGPSGGFFRDKKPFPF